MNLGRMPGKLKVLLVACGLAALFAGGMAIRLAVLNAQQSLHGRPLPFTLESALQYRLTEMVYAAGSLPVRDEAVQVPDGVVIGETYTVGAEYVYAALARLLPDSIPLAGRLRLVSVAWFCIGIPVLCLWLRWWLRSWRPAFIGAAYYAVSLSSVMRSTGQELSRENFALPLLVGHFAAGALADSRASGRVFWTATALSAALLGCAVAAWDMIQFYVFLWALLGFARLAHGGYFCDERRRISWLLHLGALVAAGLLNPYLRAHAFPTSYAMLLAYGTGLGLIMNQLGIYRGGGQAALRNRILMAGAALVPLALGILLFSAYAETYGHFMELLWAKLRFLNRKPADPALLTFAQRILWTPALHSVDLNLALTMFPAMLPLLLLSVPAILSGAPWRRDHGFAGILFCAAVSLAAFVMFMRFHVFLAVFGSALLGWTARWALEGRETVPLRCAGFLRRAGRFAVIAALLCGGVAEAAHTLTRPARWGRRLTYLSEQEELAQWMRDNAAGAPVLANFGLSAFLLAYAGCPVVLHPKFESPEIRNRVQGYGEALFLSDESGFRAWADDYGARFFVFALGEFAPVREEWQMRYFVNALSPPPEAAALIFEREPEKARLFIYLWGNPKYRVFRIIGKADEAAAASYASLAREDLSRGDIDDAENKAVLALAYNPNNEQAAEIVLNVESLRRAVANFDE